MGQNRRKIGFIFRFPEKNQFPSCIIGDFAVKYMS